jgi:chromosomal replication initiation ATPase DnaA
MKAEIILNYFARQRGVKPESIIREIQQELQGGTIQDVIENMVSLVMQVEINDIRSKKRERNIAISRQLCLYLFRKHLFIMAYRWNRKEKQKQVIEVPMPYSQIGAKYKVDHATVIHSIKVINAILETRDIYTTRVKEIINAVERELY